MSSAFLRTTAAAVATMFAVAAMSGCSEPGPVGPGPSIPPSERVTDAAAIALTEEEAERIREACGDATDLPEPGSPCWDAIEDVEPRTGDAPPDCSGEICLDFGSPTDVPGVVTIRVRDPRPGSPACQGSQVCDGFQVPAPLAERVVENVPPATTTEQEPSEPEPTEPTETEIEPTDEPTDIPPST